MQILLKKNRFLLSFKPMPRQTGSARSGQASDVVLISTKYFKKIEIVLQFAGSMYKHEEELKGAAITSENFRETCNPEMKDYPKKISA